ncbi:MAG: DinB family protein [Planctomycetes bacterium]|nr:DinB family protein [Planctomycetota bacterium]
MTTNTMHPEIVLLLQVLDDGYDKKAWHGPNLKGVIRGLTARQAAWRPNSLRRSIAEIVAHAAYWKYAVRRRLRGDKRGSFSLKGSNWFPLPTPFDERTWAQYVALLDSEHRALRQAVAEFPRTKLHQTSPGSKLSNFKVIYGVACHDVYHAGQIRLLKRLQARV